MDLSHKTTALPSTPRRLPLGARIDAARRQLTALLVDHRQGFFLAFLILIAVCESLENVLFARYGYGVHLIFDLLVFSLLVPVGVWLLLQLLEQTETERQQVTQESSLSLQFSQQLGEAATWDDLVSLIARCPGRLARVEQAVLFLRRPASPDLLPEALCDSQGQVRLRPALSSRADTLPPGSLPQLLLQGGAGDSPYRYDLPITRSDQLIGVLKLEFPADAPPGPAEIRSLKSIPPVAALALEVWMLQMLAVEEAQASQSQRRQIAQNLHDTLAQNIGYLRLKLDQLTGENAIHEIGVVLQELEHMRATADEAYRQVRGTLEELDPLSVEDLPASLQRQAGLISQRAGFTLRLSQLGSPYPLPAGLRQQILYIAREALHNVEKHARATQALIQLTWLENELIVKICDDGAGFDPRSVTGEGHYGLWIMERRAQELGGMIKIQSARPGGTEVTLWAPRPDRVMQPRVEQA